MSYATLMVYVDAGEMPEQRLGLAVSLARKFTARLIGISALAVRPPLASEGVVVQRTIDIDIQEIKARLAERGNWFRSVAGVEHQDLEWRSVMDRPTEALAREARCADLVLIGRSEGSGDVYSSIDPGGVLLKIGRPTLIVADNISVLRAEHVVIGWKDRREARRAVADALPFLREATEVTVAEICGPDEEASAQGHVDDVVRYLSRHQISAGPRVIPRREESDAAQLIQLAQQQNADLLVTGAYGHGRLGEWIFGGVTRDLLATSPICCLMSH